MRGILAVVGLIISFASFSMAFTVNLNPGPDIHKFFDGTCLLTSGENPMEDAASKKF